MTNVPLSSVSPAIAQDLFCPSCGYNLRGLTGERCPECGESIEGVRSNVCQIPWIHRKELGWWRAYWKTVYFVMCRQKQFANEMARPVRYKDAQWFRWVTVAFVVLPMLVAGLFFWTFAVRSPTQSEFFNVFWSMFGGVWHACFVIFVAAITGLPSYFFHPRTIPIPQQNRAIALSYYACGPLAFLSVPILFVAAGVVTAEAQNPTIPLGFVVLALTLPIGAIVPWWLDLIHLCRRLVPQRPQRAVGLALILPLLWILLAFLLLVFAPSLVVFVWGVFVTLS